MIEYQHVPPVLEKIGMITAKTGTTEITDRKGAIALAAPIYSAMMPNSQGKRLRMVSRGEDKAPSSPLTPASFWISSELANHEYLV